jgi:hypothetical protein
MRIKRRLCNGELRHAVLNIKIKGGLDESVPERRSEPRMRQNMSIIKSITWAPTFNPGRTSDTSLQRARSRSCLYR